MSTPARQLLWGLAGVAAVLATYVVVAFVLFILTFSLYTISVLFVYTPLAFLAIGVLGAAVSMRVPTRTQSATPAALPPLSFWCGWAICPAGYLLLLLLGS
ncbi:hypothetical protein ABZ860_22790 [Microbispora sp. NPDC046973]|uniref:hypothetical protein n=1 Tax=Microbispora sp. NPDC046973 TaxID=3155022 RepID=UPI003408223E